MAVMYDLEPGLLNYDITSYDFTSLNLPVELEGATKTTILWLITTVSSHIWKQRSSNHSVSLSATKAMVEAELMIMRNTKSRRYNIFVKL